MKVNQETNQLFSSQDTDVLHVHIVVKCEFNRKALGKRGCFNVWRKAMMQKYRENIKVNGGNQ